MKNSFWLLIVFLFLTCINSYSQDARFDSAPLPDKGSDFVQLPTYTPGSLMESGVLYNNGPVVNVVGGGPGGADGSVLQSSISLNVYGFAHQVSGPFRVADDFTNTATWMVDSIKFFAYQTGSSTTSTFTSYNFQIWNGEPGQPGSTVVFGDNTTNKMIATRWTGAYRYLDTSPGTTRPIMENVVSGGFILTPGTYWVDWQCAGTVASGPWVPPITITGTTITGNAMQQATGVWGWLKDSSSATNIFPQGLPFIIYGNIADAGVLAPFNLNLPAPGVTISSLPLSNTPVTISWDTSRATATYKWIFGAPTVPPRTLTVSTGTNNFLTLTLGQLDVILAGLGLAQGDSIVGQWDVWAFRNNPPDNDSLKAANGLIAITLKREKPVLIPFSLVSPPNNSTVVTSAFNSAPINITWRKSGDAVTYKWKYGSALDTKTGKAAILTLPSNNGGYDTVLTVINSALDGVLAGLGIAPGDSSAAQWTVYTYSGTDSLKAAETFNITLKRQAKGDVLVAYDSTAALGRTSRDSVAAVLARNGITFDLFNKGIQTSTSVISFRGYKKIFWLGEGTSVMSVVQKDSIKAYLNSGTPDIRSQLIIFSEDIGYQLGRTASTYYDLDFMNNYLGANYLLDRPASGAAQGLIGLAINSGQTDSTIGSWPDVLGLFGASEALYRFRYDPTAYNAIGNKTPNFEVATFGVDVESLRPAIDSPPGSPVERMVMAAYNYLVIPVELTSFTSTVTGNNVLLSWSTATEVNNSGFQVERKTVDGNYTSIGFVQGKGTTTEIQDYIFSDNNVVVGKYSYRLKQIDFNGTYQYGPEVEVEIGLPIAFELSQNYPNPFNPTTSIKFSLVSDSRVTLKLFDVIGQEVMTSINTDLAAGYHSTIVDGSKLSSGVYFYRLDAAGINGQKYTSVKKMILTK